MTNFISKALLFEYNMLIKTIPIILKNLYMSLKSMNCGFYVWFNPNSHLIEASSKRMYRLWSRGIDGIILMSPFSKTFAYFIHHGLESCVCVQQPQTHYKHTHPQSCINFFWHNGLLGDYKRCLRLQEGDRAQRFGTWTECRFPPSQ